MKEDTRMGWGRGSPAGGVDGRGGGELSMGAACGEARPASDGVPGRCRGAGFAGAGRASLQQLGAEPACVREGPGV